jgi:hypothetical protein
MVTKHGSVAKELAEDDIRGDVSDVTSLDLTPHGTFQKVPVRSD